jgi:hypothetical protein
MILQDFFSSNIFGFAGFKRFFNSHHEVSDSQPENRVENLNTPVGEYTWGFK